MGDGGSPQTLSAAPRESNDELRLRAILEHGAVRGRGSTLLAARTNLAPPWLRWWMFAHHVNCHIEHHLYPSIPHYNLPEAHRELQAAGLLKDAEGRRIAAGEVGPPAHLWTAGRGLSFCAFTPKME